jgi:hypothetical protein
MSQSACPAEFLQARVSQTVLKVDCIPVDLVADAESVEDLSVKDVQQHSFFQIPVPVAVTVGKIGLNGVLKLAKLLDCDLCRHLVPTLHIDADTQHCLNLQHQNLDHRVLRSDLGRMASQVLRDVLRDADLFLESDAEGLNQDQVADQQLADCGQQEVDGPV